MVKLIRRNMVTQNLYADRIFSHNPLALWALDDSISGTPTDISSISSVSSLFGIPATSYGETDFYGYYCSPSNSLSAILVDNSSTAMIYGATNSTTLKAGSGKPSVIIPGSGFLHNNGKYKTRTLEMWIRIANNVHYPRRIFGPVASTDGLYTNGPMLSIKIGSYLESYFVGEWERPMLLSLQYTETNFSLIINGEQVLSINIDASTLSFPTEANQDWLGFYHYSNDETTQIDCLAIFPYKVSLSDSKLHFVWGQAVESPEIKNTNYAGSPVIADYQMSKYANNYNYPGAGRWKNGILNNLIIDSNGQLSVPDYALPSVVFEDTSKLVSDWYDVQQGLANQSLTSTLADGTILNDNVFFQINPKTTDDEWGSQGYLYFDKLNLLSSGTEAFYGVFKYPAISGELNAEEILFKITNSSDQYFEAIVKYTSTSTAKVIYRFSDGNSTTTVDGQSITADTKFVAGVYIKDLSLSTTFSDRITSFFYNKASLKVYVGGQTNFTSTFTGYVYKVGFSDSLNLEGIKALFSDGLLKTYSSTLASFIASYTLISVNTFEVFSLDIAVKSSWQDYVPLKLLAKTITKSNGEKAYDLDFLQINMDYPLISNLSNALLKSYISFSNALTAVPGDNQSDRSVISASSTKIVSPNITDKYEITTNTIVYPPTGVSIDDALINIFLNFSIPGIVRNPIRLRSYQIAAQAFDETTLQGPIGTKINKDIYSYGNNPYTIYKNSTPYLYLTKHSGFKLLGSTFDGSRGLHIPINPEHISFYQVGMIQMFILKDTLFTTEPVEIFRIKSEDDLQNEIIIYATRSDASGYKATMSAKKNGVTFTDIAFYVNGVVNAPIKYNEWNVIEVSFTKTLTFGGAGYEASPPDLYIKLTGPFTYNNVSDYQVSQVNYRSRVTFTPWSNVYNATTDQKWNTVTVNQTKKWNEVYNLIIIPSGLGYEANNITRIYNSYFGNNRVSVESTSPSIIVDSAQYSVYSGVATSNKIIKPL